MKLEGSAVEEARGLPTGRLGRFARMMRLGADAGAGLALARARRDEAGTAAAARRASAALGHLRGLATKVGQMASYVDGLVPDAQQDAFAAAMATLRDRAPTSPFDAVRAQVEQELGAPLDALFVRFDEAPFASASIGQVHRAALADGTEVAVKVQHPGVGEAVAADLDNASLLEPLFRAVGGAHIESARIFGEVRARFEEELDYRREAAAQRALAAAFAGDPVIRVPAVIVARSSGRVLTSTFATGASFEHARAAPEAERAAWARTLYRFVHTSMLRDGRFQADPHPGNFLFRPGGEVVFLDFGCVEVLDETSRAQLRGMHAAAAARDEAAFAAWAARWLRARGGVYERAMVGYLRQAYAPRFDSPFRVTRAWARELVERTQQAKREILLTRDGSTAAIPPGMIFVNRLQFGLYAVLARLDCVLDYAAIDRAALNAHG